MGDMRIPPTVSPYSTGIEASGFSMQEMFPEVDPQFEPFGGRVLLQLRRVMNKTKSGIVLVEDTKATEAWNINIGKVIRLGPLAFKRRSDGEPWPEGLWATTGDFVMIPKYQGSRRSVEADDGMGPVVIVLCNDAELVGRFTGDPRNVRAYIE